jgi:FlaA1/EpsC-like NDP-sugar epimerase
MNSANIIAKVFHYKHIDELMVSRLYALSQKSVVAVMLFSSVLVYSLYPMLTTSIIIWFIVLILISLLRLYFAYIKQKDPTKFQLSTWYKIFVLGAFSTAVLFSII